MTFKSKINRKRENGTLYVNLDYEKKGTAQAREAERLYYELIDYFSGGDYHFSKAVVIVNGLRGAKPLSQTQRIYQMLRYFKIDRRKAREYVELFTNLKEALERCKYDTDLLFKEYKAEEYYKKLSVYGNK